MGYDPPIDPSAHPPLAVIPAPLQAMITPQHVYPTLDPRTELVSLPESMPLLLRPAIRGHLAHMGQGHVLDARFLRRPLVRRRRDPPVRRQHPRRPAELLLVVRQALGQVRPVLAPPFSRTEYPVTIPPSTSSSRIFRPNSTGLPALNRGITCVCGSNSESDSSGAGTGSSLRTRRSAWPMPCFSRGRISPRRSASRRAAGSSAQPATVQV
jgi:hypothetical protein